MTVSSTTTTVSYAGNGSTTAFAVTFPFYELTAYLTTAGIESELTSGTHYTLSGGSGATGTLTMVTAPASGTTLRIKRTTARTQLVDYSEGDGFPAETHEKALDRAYMIIQELEATLVDDVLNFNEIADSDDITEGDTNLFHRETGDEGLTQIDGLSWGQFVGMRLGRDLDGVGTASAHSANQFNLVLHSHITGPTNSQVSYLRAGLISIISTADPSEYGPDITRDAVGADTRAYADVGNMLARLWGDYNEFYFPAGSDGYGVGNEIFCNNSGSDQPLFDTSTTKLGLHLVATGAYPTTAAIKLAGISGRTFYHGMWASPSVIGTSLWTLDGLATVLVNGSAGFGTATPDRRLHSEVADAVTNAVTYAARLTHITSGTAAANFGVGQEFELESAGGTNRVAGRTNVYLTDATNGAEFAEFSVDLINNGSISTGLLKVSPFGLVTAAGAFAVGANQVVGARGAAIADASGGATVDSQARTALNALLAHFRTWGSIAT